MDEMKELLHQEMNTRHLILCVCAGHKRQASLHILPLIISTIVRSTVAPSDMKSRFVMISISKRVGWAGPRVESGFSFVEWSGGLLHKGTRE